MSNHWFEVDRAGLSLQAEELGKGRLVAELIQNALDEAGVTRIEVTLAPIPGRALAELIVEDDSPNGFQDLTHAYTLFAQSYKRGNPEQRGQFNLGEKFVIACCESASISTTTGTVVFDADGRHDKPRQKRERGSEFVGRLRMTREKLVEALAFLRTLILPDSVSVILNDEMLLSRKPIHEFEATLPTVIADDEGVMRPRQRKSKISVYEINTAETAHLYEMGLPIVETGDKWHVSIGQKVPLNRDRNNVTPSYLRTVRTLVVNEMHSFLDEHDANANWVRQASSDPDCSNEAINRVLDLRFGLQRAAYDPSDPEANKIWLSKGGTLVHGSNLNAAEWANAKEAGAILPAGQLTPSPKPYSEGGIPAEAIPPADWSDGMRQIANYAVFVAGEIMQVSIKVYFVDIPNRFQACYGSGRLGFNLRHLARGWFDSGINHEIDALLIHEFGHQYSGDHLSSQYYDALCDLGARLKQLALEKPAELQRYSQAVVQQPENA